MGPRRFAPLHRALTPSSASLAGRSRTIPFLISREEHLLRLGPIAESMGFHFHRLEGVEELQRYLGQFPVPAVWADSDFMDGDWRDVLALCRQQTPVVPLVVTALADSPGQWAEALEAGVAEFLAPPFAAPEVRRCLLSALGDEALLAPAQAAH